MKKTLYQFDGKLKDITRLMKQLGYRHSIWEVLEDFVILSACSMADLFGQWVPTSWILEVFDACMAAPQHRYLFLTKNPKRYAELAEHDLLLKGDNGRY